MELSLIIRPLEPTLQRFRQFLATRSASFEIIVVDDSSADNTVAVVAALASQWQALRVVRSPANRGKGHVVRLGMQAATGHMHVFSDADGSTLTVELDKLLQALAEGVDIAIGSRYLAASLVTRPQPWFRLV
jgi:dolichyl-phosphate beta-glucosyltransferase